MVSTLAFIFWVLVAVMVLAYLLRTSSIDSRRLRGWGEFAKRYKLQFERGSSPSDPVSVYGQLNGRRMLAFTSFEQGVDDRLGSLFTQIDVYLNNGPATSFLISKKPLPDAFADISMPDIFAPNSPDWPMPAVSMVVDRAVLDEWFTPLRMLALKRYMDFLGPKGEGGLAGDGDELFLTWRSLEDVVDAKDLNSLVQKIYGFAREFELGDTGKTENPKASSVIVPPVSDA